jgi:PAS domain S-box-containing protein
MNADQTSQDGVGDREDIAHTLRKRAEEIVRANEPKSPVALQPEPAQRLIHELRVYQAELEMQNDELRQTREKLEAAKARYFNFYNLAPVGYFTINGEGVILDANQTAGNFLGVTRDHLVNRPFTNFIPFDDQDIFYLFRKKLLETGKPQSCEIKMTCEDDCLFSARIEATIADDPETGTPVLYFVMSDITERKREEAELRQAKEEAEEATKLKDQFVSLVAHDLRSPFSSMMGLLKLFVQRKPLPADDHDKGILDTIISNGDRMIMMIGNLLKIGRFQCGKIAIHPRFFNARAAATATIGLFAHYAEQKGIKIINEVPPEMRLYADQALFDEVLLNLLSNAIKFCSQGDKITFCAQPGSSAITVWDTGKGIDETIINGAYKQGALAPKPGTMGEMGTGVGLPYSHQILKAHGGDLTAELGPDKGSVFCAILPHVRPIAMVVDADPAARSLAKAHLEKIDIQVIEADGVEMAISIIGERPPHLVITGINMPDMNGYALLDRLKLDLLTKDIPVIAMTSMERESREKAMLSGADDFVKKPIDADDLVLRVRRFLG